MAPPYFLSTSQYFKLVVLALGGIIGVFFWWNPRAFEGPARVGADKKKNAIRVELDKQDACGSNCRLSFCTRGEPTAKT